MKMVLENEKAWQTEESKQWYQRRFEEQYPNCKVIPLETFFIGCTKLSGRLKRKIFVRCHLGGIVWQFAVRRTDWKAVYGSEGGNA